MSSPINVSDYSSEEALYQVLGELETGFPRWQAALIHGSLGEFQECTRGLAALARSLQVLVSNWKSRLPASHRDLASTAISVHQQASLFLATLRRARRLLDARSQALAGRSQIYAQPVPTRPEAVV